MTRISPASHPCTLSQLCNIIVTNAGWHWGSVLCLVTWQVRQKCATIWLSEIVFSLRQQAHCNQKNIQTVTQSLNAFLCSVIMCPSLSYMVMNDISAGPLWEQEMSILDDQINISGQVTFKDRHMMDCVMVTASFLAQASCLLVGNPVWILSLAAAVVLMRCWLDLWLE